MKRQFWGGECEIFESDFNGRVEIFFDNLKTCFVSVVGKSFENLSSVKNLRCETPKDIEDLQYFFSWLKKEGLENIKFIANFSLEKADSSLEHALDNCIFILEDTKFQEDKEIACENIADAIMILSKAIQEHIKVNAVPLDSSSNFTIKIKAISNNFGVIETDLIFDDGIFPFAA